MTRRLAQLSFQPDTLHELDEWCKVVMLPRSRVVEAAVLDYLAQRRKEAQIHG